MSLVANDGVIAEATALRATPAIRLDMPEADAQAVSTLLVKLRESHPQITERLRDQLWLMVALVEQRRRINVPERPEFTARANRILAMLDPPEAPDGVIA